MESNTPENRRSFETRQGLALDGTAFRILKEDPLLPPRLTSRDDMESCMPAPRRMKRKEHLRKLIGNQEVNGEKLTRMPYFDSPSDKEQDSGTLNHKKSLDGSETSEQRKFCMINAQKIADLLCYSGEN